MLSPKIKATLSLPINSSPIKKASASPLGFSCTWYFKDMPKSLPSPKSS